MISLPVLPRHRQCLPKELLANVFRRWLLGGGYHCCCLHFRRQSRKFRFLSLLFWWCRSLALVMDRSRAELFTSRYGRYFLRAIQDHQWTSIKGRMLRIDICLKTRSIHQVWTMYRKVSIYFNNMPSLEKKQSRAVYVRKNNPKGAVKTSGFIGKKVITSSFESQWMPRKLGVRYDRKRRHFLCGPQYIQVR